MPQGEEAKDQQKQGEEGKQPETPPTDEGKKQEEKKYTDADVNALLDKKFGELSAKLEKKYADQLQAEKDKFTEAQKLEKMNEDEKTKYQNEQLKAENAALKQEISLSEQMAVARKELKEANIVVSDKLLSMIVSPDAERTKQAVDSFKETWTKDLNAAVQDALKRNPPKADPQNPPKGKSAGATYAEKYNAQRVPKNPE